MANIVSNLPDWRNGQRCWHWCDWRRVAAHDRDDLIAVHLEPRVEPHDDVVGEHTLGILLGAASLQWQLDLVAQVAFADDLTGTVTIEVRVGDAVKLFVEFHIHLWVGEGKKRFSDIFAQKTEFKSVELLLHLHRRRTHPRRNNSAGFGVA